MYWTYRLVSLWLACAVAVSRSYVVQPAVWKFRGHPIAYERAHTVQGPDATTTKSDARTNPNSNDNKKARHSSSSTDATPVLLLNGFGVGSFHQHRLIDELLGDDQHVDRPIYRIDYLGQGRSWPENCQDGQGETERGLRYCGSTWTEQVTAFIEQVILPQHPGQKIHLAGNSLGGHLAAFVAAARPDLVQSLTLMNATPVWGLNLPGWNGVLPAPWVPKLVGRYLFDRIRDLTTIEQYLLAAYGNRNSFDNDLMQQIRACTESAGGHAAFASILWSPPVTVQSPHDDRDITSFYDALTLVDCDVLLLFGAEDPWCKPAFAKRMLQKLQSRASDKQSRYVEVGGVGHCPNHEAPKATAMVLNDWWCAEDTQTTLPFSIREAWGQTTVRQRDEQDIPLSFVDRLAVTFV